MKFDPNRPHGTVHGAEDGKHYHQDGQYYCSDGTPWSAPAVSQGDSLPQAATTAPEIFTDSPEFKAAVAAQVAKAVAAEVKKAVAAALAANKKSIADGEANAPAATPKADSKDKVDRNGPTQKNLAG